MTLHPAHGRAWAAQWRSISALLFPAVLVGLIAVLVGSPYWPSHVLAGVLAFAMSATLAAAGFLLMLGTGSRKSGAFMVGAAFLSAVSWVSAWDRGIWPGVGELAQSLFFFFLGTGILLAGRPRFESWYEWAWSVLAFLILPVQELVLMGVASPTAVGYSARTYWPSLRIPDQDVNAFLHVGSWLYVILAITFVIALIAQRHGPAKAGRRTLLPVLCTGVFAVGAALIEWPIQASDISLDRVMSAQSAQTAAAIVIPLALFASAMAAKWEEITLASKVQSLLGVITPNSVESALRDVLRDPELRIWLWVPAKSCYIDADGHIRSSDEATSEGRRLHKVHTAKRETLALCDIRASLTEEGGLLRAAMQASTSALLAIQLQVEKLEQLRAVQTRLMEVELETRRELARNIHDGVQQDLAALSIEIGRLRRRCPTCELRDQVSECGTRVAGITQEVRRIGRGLHPQALLERGLAGALEEDAERLGTSVALDVESGRLPPRIEVAMYYMLAEALTNVHKHANAETVTVSVRQTGEIVVADIVDDGVGGAALTFGGGLHGIDDRVRALRGSLTIESERSRGTRLGIKVPLSGGSP